jgi:ribosomal protein S18 acetylase RimI-like enzyme
MTMNDHPDCPIALQHPNLNLTIRQVRLSDGSLLHSHLWQNRDHATIQDFIQRLLKFEAKKRGTGIVVLDNTRSSEMIIAYGQVTQWVKCAEISDLFVHPSYRGQGIGTAMIQYLTHHVLTLQVSCVELGVAISNQRALALYRRLGFKDSYTLQLDLGKGTESVLYLAIDLTPFINTT